MQAPLNEARTMEALDAALRSTAADEFEISVLARSGEYTRFAGQVIHQPQDIVEVQYLVRALVNGHPYRVATSTAADLERAVAAAAAGASTRAELSKEAGQVRLAGPQPDAAPGPLWYADTEAYDVAARTSLAKRAMAEAIEAGGEAAGMLGRAVTQQLVATTAGIRRATAATEASGSLTATIDDGTAHWVDLSRSAARLDVARSVSRAVAQAQAGRGRADLPAGTVPGGPRGRGGGGTARLPARRRLHRHPRRGRDRHHRPGRPAAGRPPGRRRRRRRRGRGAADRLRHRGGDQAPGRLLPPRPGRRGGHRPGHRRRPRPAVNRARAHRPRAGPRADRAQHRHVRRRAAPRTSSSPSSSTASTCSDSGTRGWWTGSRARSPGSPGTPAS